MRRRQSELRGRIVPAFGLIVLGLLAVWWIAGGVSPSADSPLAAADRAVEIRANVFAPSAQANAVVAVDPRGESVVAWDSRRQEAGTYGVYARAFDALGRPLTHEVHVNQYLPGIQHKPAVAKADDGSAWIVWESRGQDGSQGAILARRFDRMLRPLGPEILVHDETAGDQRQPVVAASLDGGALVAWASADPISADTAQIRSRRLLPDGTLGEEIAVSERDGLDGLPSLSALPGDRFAVAWARSKAGPDSGLYLRVLGADSGAETRLDGAGVDAIEPSLTADSSGRLTLAWLSPDTEGYAVWVQRLDDATRPIDSPRRIAGAESGWKSGVAVASHPDGRYVVAYNSDDGNGEGVFAQLFAADDSRISATPERLTQQFEGDQQLAVASGAQRVVWTGDGGLAVAWSGDGGLGDGHGAHLTAFPPAGLKLAAAPPLGTPEAAPAVRSDDLLVARPPTYDPSARRLPRLSAEDVEIGGDFGFQAVNNAPWDPPDPEMAVGTDSIVVMTNGNISTFDKSGTLLWEDEIESSFGFWGELGANFFVFDPEVTWDPHDSRFIAMACEQADNGEDYFLLAISLDASPDDRDDWLKWRLDVTALSNSGFSDFIDSPNLAVNRDFVQLTADFFSPTDEYLVLVVDKASLLAGDENPVSNFELIQGANQQSMGVPVVYSDTSTLYIVQSTEISFGDNDKVILHAITDPLGSYDRQTFELTVDAYRYPASPPQKGTSSRPTLFEPRFWSVAERNGSIWAVHHVNNSRTRVRWYEFDLGGWPEGGTPSVAQSGEIDLGDGIYTYFPSLHVDAMDNAAITFARSAANEYISMGRTVRKASDPPGTFRPVQIVQTSQNPSTVGRWGDYSATQADPLVIDTFWGHHEYTVEGFGDWRTWVARYDVQPEAMVLTADPLVAGSSATFVATGATPGATVYFLASVAGTGITEVPALTVALSLESPIQFLGTAVANVDGMAVLTRNIPGPAAGRDVWLQAAEDRRTTNWEMQTVQ